MFNVKKNFKSVVDCIYRIIISDISHNNKDYSSVRDKPMLVLDTKLIKNKCTFFLELLTTS